jgi:hypothetical protein
LRFQKFQIVPNHRKFAQNTKKRVTVSGKESRKMNFFKISHGCVIFMEN